MPFQLCTPNREASLNEASVLHSSLPFATHSWNGTHRLKTLFGTAPPHSLFTATNSSSRSAPVRASTKR